MMRGTVVAGEAAAVHAEDHRQILQAHVVHDGIEGALQEGGVDRAERLESLGRQPGRKKHRVLLGNAHIEILVGMMRAEAVEAGAVGHGGGNGHDLLIQFASLTSVSAKTSE